MRQRSSVARAVAILTGCVAVLTTTAFAERSVSGGTALSTTASVASSELGRRTSEPLRLRFGGDVIFGRYRNGKYVPLSSTGESPFKHVSSLLKSDLTVVNLETPIIDHVPEKRQDTRPLFFGAPPAAARFLAEAGISAVSLGNNHAADMGLDGLLGTPRHLGDNDVVSFGAARPTERPTTKPRSPRADGFSPTPELVRVETVQRRDWRVGFVSVTSILNFQSLAMPQVPFVPVDQLSGVLGPVLRAAREDHDILIVLMHWGTEYAAQPSVSQRRSAHALIDSGADLVVGHHPHVLQPLERYGDGLIAYSLGNFLFDSERDPGNLGGVLGLDVEAASCVVRLQFHPLELGRSSTGVTLKLAQGRAVGRARFRLQTPDYWHTGNAAASDWSLQDDGLVTDNPLSFRCRSRAPSATAAPG